MKILIPVQYPLSEVNKRAIRRGMALAEGHENPELLVFHMNEVQKSQRITRKTLRDAVESLFEDLTASYTVRDGFFIEEAIIEEAIRLNMDYIVLSSHRRNRWKQLLEQILGIDQNLEQFIRDQTGIEVEVVSDVESESTNG